MTQTRFIGSKIPMDEFLARCFASIRDKGFVSVTKSKNTGKTPTWAIAGDADYIKETETTITDDDWENADSAFDIYLDVNSDEQNSFYDKVAEIAPKVDVNNILDMKIAAGVAGWCVAYQHRIKVQIKLHKSGITSKHVGATGDIYEGVLIVNHIHHTHGQWGHTKITTMADSSGNVFVWFNTGKAELELNRRYTVRGRIRAHREYRKVKQTVISRCRAKVVSNG